MKNLMILLIIFLLLGYVSPSYSLEKETHSSINQYISENSLNSFSLDSYLKSKLGFAKGKDQPINGKKVFEYIKEGGIKEDEPMYTRSFNHFHNPLKSWDKSGLKGTSQSAIIWAQEQGFLGSLFDGNFSWKAVREYYYIALTGRDFSNNLVAFTQANKEKNFSKTFRGIGQIMHLVQDMSVPAHTRDDAHVISNNSIDLLSHYELAVDKMRTSKDPLIKKIYEDAVAKPFTFAPSILSLTPNPLAPIPIAKIFDTDIYYNTNPDPIVTASTNIGLSEYTNANFVSEGLTTASFKDFPYPRIQDTTIVKKSYIGSLGTYHREYYKKTCCGETNEGKGYLLSAVDYLDYWRKKSPILVSGLPKIPILDDNVYNDYASLLIPRAVGYSAGLLDYFFRGILEISAPDTYAHSVIDGSVLPQQFTRIKAKVRNTTPDESMGEGILQAVAKYRKRTNYSPDLTADPPTADSREAEYSYSASSPVTITSLSSTTPQEFTFDFSANPIPAGITDLYLTVVFKGTLGNETDTAIAVGLKDLMEPTHHVFWNASDRFLLDGQLMTAEQIEELAANDETLRQRLDPDGDGLSNDTGEPYIYPHEMTFRIGYMDASTLDVIPWIAYGVIPPGRHMRIIALVDDVYDNWLRFEYSDNIDTNKKWGDYTFEAVVSQEDANGVFQAITPVSTFRAVRQHFYAGVVRCEPEEIDPETGYSYCPYPEDAPPPADLTPSPVNINFQ